MRCRYQVAVLNGVVERGSQRVACSIDRRVGPGRRSPILLVFLVRGLVDLGDALADIVALQMLDRALSGIGALRIRAVVVVVLLQ